tara:strand:- start:2348 stop:3058 length:711 start_codon:yes stop_codon:yes gene_type:complete
MATINASLTLSSGDLLTSNLAFSVASTLTTAGTQATGLSKTTGLARTNFTNDPIQSKTLYRSDDALTNGSNKVYLKNLSTTATEFFTIYIDQEEMGRLYAGDWAFFPWAAKAGVKETFVVTVGGTWVVGETLEFDGVLTAANSTAVNGIAAQINAEHYPNWTTTVSTAAVTFTARQSVDAGTVVTATADWVIVQAGGSDATAVVSAAAMGTATSSDIMVVPSVVTTMDLEHMLLHE